MRAKWVALALTVVLAFYLLVLGHRGVLLVATGEPAAVGLGLGVLLLPLLGAYAVWRELRFGASTQRMGAELGDEGGLPVQERRADPAQRRQAADAAFPRYLAETEQAPGDWRAWYRLGLAYDACGDRTRARAAMRHAAALHAEAPRGAQPDSTSGEA